MKTYINTVLTLALLCATPCLAKGKTTNTSADAGCPVEITNSSVSTPPAGELYIGYRAYVDYKNNTTKKLIGEEFGLDVMSAVGDWSPYFGDLDMAANVKPGKRNFNNSWRIYPGQISGSRFYVKKLSFDDGTSWTDDGTKKCQFVRDNRR